jgi:type VII secretion-associated serine protease mycosin
MNIVRSAALAALFWTMLPPTAVHADGIRDAEWHLAFLKVNYAHRVSQGQGVVVAIVDSGVDGSHADLTGNVLPGVDLKDQGSGDGQRDLTGHGTAMAGLVASHGRSEAGMLGIAPMAKVLPVRVSALEHDLASRDEIGISWAITHGANIICFARTSSDAPQLQESIEKALAADVVVVAAAGNRPEATRVSFPAAYPGVIAAAGVDRNGNHADISVTGPEIVLSAPAVDIVSTNTGGGYRKGTGTSDATAIIAGAAALVRARFPELSAEEVVHRLTATAIDKGPPGRDDQYGYGIVDLVGALTKDVPPLHSASPSPAAVPTQHAQDGDNNSTKSSPVIILALIGLLLVASAVTFGVVRARKPR